MTTNSKEVERIVVTQDGASTYEIRVGSTLKGGIFAHDLGKFLTDILHQELQKAREDWLRGEIVKLEGMKKEIDLHPETNADYLDFKNDYGFNQALQTIIDRYQSELDQPTYSEIPNN